MKPQPRSMTVSATTVRPLWREGAVWALAAGPLIVVVAGVITAAVAMHSPDPIIGNAHQAGEPAAQPALVGRNKAAELASTPSEARR